MLGHLSLNQNIRFREVLEDMAELSLEDNLPKQESLPKDLPRSNPINIPGRPQKYDREVTKLPKPCHFSPEPSYRVSFADSVFPIELQKSYDSYTDTYSLTDSLTSSSESEDATFGTPETRRTANKSSKEIAIVNLAKQHFDLEETPELHVGMPDLNPYPIKKEVTTPSRIKDTDPYVGALRGTRNNFPKKLEESYSNSKTKKETPDEMSTSPESSNVALSSNGSSARETDEEFLMFDMEIN